MLTHRIKLPDGTEIEFFASNEELFNAFSPFPPSFQYENKIAKFEKQKAKKMARKRQKQARKKQR